MILIKVKYLCYETALQNTKSHYSTVLPDATEKRFLFHAILGGRL